MQNMKSSKSPEIRGDVVIIERPAGIVRIAYRQLSAMCGIVDPCAPKSDLNPALENKPVFNSARRIFGLPLILSLSSTVYSAYDALKKSHSSVTSVLNATEVGIGKSVEIVSPITAKIGSTLENPLKSFDNVVCLGLDFLEENVPSITGPSVNLMETVQNYFRCTVSSLATFYLSAVSSIQNISQITIEDVKSEDAQVGTEKTSKKNNY